MVLLTRAKHDEVVRRLETGTGLKRTACAARVSLSVVRKIARGERQSACKGEPDRATGEVGRCPGCGAKLCVWPCLACGIAARGRGMR